MSNATGIGHLTQNSHHQFSHSVGHIQIPDGAGQGSFALGCLKGRRQALHLSGELGPVSTQVRPNSAYVAFQRFEQVQELAHDQLSW